MMFLSVAIRRISPGSLVTTVIWPSDGDWMTAPTCESATEPRQMRLGCFPAKAADEEGVPCPDHGRHCGGDDEPARS